LSASSFNTTLATGFLLSISEPKGGVFVAYIGGRAADALRAFADTHFTQECRRRHHNAG